MPTTRNLSRLTTSELGHAIDAVDILMAPAITATMEPELRIRLGSYCTDLRAHKEDREMAEREALLAAREGPAEHL